MSKLRDCLAEALAEALWDSWAEADGKERDPLARMEAVARTFAAEQLHEAALSLEPDVVAGLVSRDAVRKIHLRADALEATP